jgi:uncharacterized peroxidase-related enzyme
VSGRLPLPDFSSAGDGLAAEYEAAQSREGAVMAILRALGPRPELVRAFVALADAALYGPGFLSRRERELLAVAVSEANGAAYSAEVHSSLLASLEAGPDARAARDDALVSFARRLTLSPREASEAVAALREQLSDDEVYDALAVVGLLSFANRSALATGITTADDLR